MPFIVNSSPDFKDEYESTFACDDENPLDADAYIEKSNDLSILFNAIKKHLRAPFSTEEYNNKIRAKDIDTLLKLGLAYRELQRDKEAMKVFQEIIEIDPNNADANYELGVISLYTLKTHDKALYHFKETVRIKPDHGRGYILIAQVYRDLGMYREAIDTYKLAIQLIPNVREAYYFLGKLYTKLRMFREAIEIFEQLSDIDKDSKDAYEHFAFACFWFCMYKEALEAFKKVIRKKHDSEIYCFLGRTYFELGNYKEAIDIITEAVKLKPDYVMAHYILGLAYLNTGQKSKALEEHQLLKNIDSELAEELFNLIYK